MEKTQLTTVRFMTDDGYKKISDDTEQVHPKAKKVYDLFKGFKAKCTDTSNIVITVMSEDGIENPAVFVSACCSFAKEEIESVLKVNNLS